MFKKSQQTSIYTNEKLNIPNGTRYKEIQDLTSEEKNATQEHATELKFALVSFCLSTLIVISKLLFMNRIRIYKVYSTVGTYVYGGKYESSDSVTKLSEVLLLFFSTMLEILHGSKWLLIPLGAGLGMTILTWYTVYFDSCIPGVKPPTPFSPNKSRLRLSPRYHTGYIVAIVNGLLVFLLTFFSWS